MIAPKIIAHIRGDEGCKIFPYVDTRGFLTIGFGHKILPGEDFTDGITQAQADQIFASDLGDVEDGIRGVLDCYDTLNEVRQGVVLDMAFNLGLHGFSEFKRLIAALSAGDFVSAANEMINSVWYTQVKSRGVDDVNLMRRGTWS